MKELKYNSQTRTSEVLQLKECKTGLIAIELKIVIKRLESWKKEGRTISDQICWQIFPEDKLNLALY